ncbi:hypothetical protein [Chelatococcus reniformis]|uniref:DUF4352 domain-containing protein n=1 Tax=Chelatococcus reniformis TaxID=1494448 RepID=A0A916XJ37_9HYPH|nr:hypothetical protein [Chelatococcus reniformis]GGC75778.1 hypothetical protein GCM10010994_37760 [Chelatococcus reniformis]
MRVLMGVVVLGVAALLCYGLQASKPRPVDLARTVPVAGRQGETVRGRFLAGRVDKVEFARNLKVPFDREARTLTTDGLWVVVTLELEAMRQPVVLYRRTWNGPSGLTFHESDRAPAGLPTGFMVGQASRGRLVFEIRPEAASGASLHLSRDWISRFDSELRIDLDAIPRDPAGGPDVVDTLDLSLGGDA